MSFEQEPNRFTSPELDRSETEDIYIHALSASESPDNMATSEGSYYVSKYADTVVLYTLPKKDQFEKTEHLAVPLNEWDTTKISPAMVSLGIMAAICVKQVADGEIIQRNFFFRAHDPSSDVGKIWSSQHSKIIQSVREANLNVNRRLTHDLHRRGRLL